MFADVDFSAFWTPGEYPESLIEPSPTDAMISEIQAELGYRLPQSYIALSRIQNGGLPRCRFHSSPSPTSYGADDHIEIAEIYAIGRSSPWALGRAGCNNAFWINECNYPAIGVYFGNCPDSGHQMLALDYRTCGNTGEPSVVLVDEIEDYNIVPLAIDFETFIQGLRNGWTS